jgi:hypothetical protein
MDDVERGGAAGAETSNIDVVMDEDQSRARKDHGPENLARLRRFALNILRANQDKHSTGARSSAPHGTMRSSSFSPRPNAIALPPSVLSALASLRWAMVSVGYDQSQQCFIEYKTYCHPDTLRRARRRSDRQAFEPLRQLPPAPTPTPSAVAMSDYPVASRALPPCNSSRSAPKNQRLRLRLGTVCGKRGS